MLRRILPFLVFILFLLHAGSWCLLSVLPKWVYPLLGSGSFGLCLLLFLAETRRQIPFNLHQIQSAVDSVRTLKHDLANQLQVIHGLAQNGSIEALKEYTSNLVEEIREIPVLFDTRNAPLNALLHAKWAVAVTKKIDFRIEVHCPVCLGRKESYLLVRILGNIMDNAFEALQNTKNPQVAVTVKRDDRHYLFEVENNGPPIPEAEQRLIFERGYSTKRHPETRGLGLYIVRQLLHQTRGEIQLTSTEAGTRFLIRIPGKTSHQNRNSLTIHTAETDG